MEFAESAGQFECLGGQRWCKSSGLVFRKTGSGQGVDDLLPGIEPENLREIRRVLEHVLSAQPEDFLAVGPVCHFQRQLLKLLFVAVQVEAQILLQPQDILDQCGTFLFGLGAVK